MDSGVGAVEGFWFFCENILLSSQFCFFGDLPIPSVVNSRRLVS